MEECGIIYIVCILFVIFELSLIHKKLVNGLDFKILVIILLIQSLLLINYCLQYKILYKIAHYSFWAFILYICLLSDNF